jgi:hypothetical protein
MRTRSALAPILVLAIAVALALATASCSSGGAETDTAGQESAAGTEPTVVTRGDIEPTEQGVSEPTAVSREEAAVPASSGPVQLDSPEYGVQAFLWWRPEIAERDMLLVKDMGFDWIKQNFGWRDIELEKGKFDWSHTDHIVETAQRYGDLNLLIRVDHQPQWARAGCSLQGPPEDEQDLADFLEAVATRYKGRIAAYEIWNEPNLAREWCDQSPDPEGYAHMLAAAYAAVKRADPDAYVISAGLSPTGSQPPVAMPDDVFLERLYQAMGGSSDGYFDILGVHAAGYAAPPETSPEEAAANEAYGGERFFTFRRVEDLRAIQEKYEGPDGRIAVLEMGWTSDPRPNSPYSWHAVDEQTKADYLVRAYQFAAEHWAPWITIMTTIYICDPDWTPDDEQYWWCITNPDGTPRPAFEALKGMPKVGQ